MKNTKYGLGGFLCVKTFPIRHLKRKKFDSQLPEPNTDQKEPTTRRVTIVVHMIDAEYFTVLEHGDIRTSSVISQ